MLQWGEIATDKKDFSVAETSGDINLRSIHRRKGVADIFFVANLSRANVAAKCSLAVSGRQPELWNPVTGERRELPEFECKDGKTFVPLEFASAESFFLVFRKPISTLTRFHNSKNFPELDDAGEISGTWQVSFDPKWGGPKLVTFDTLADWTQNSEDGIKYYSGTATYTKTFDLQHIDNKGSKSRIWLDLGTVHALAEVTLNGKDIGVVWTAPWRTDVTSAVKMKDNILEIKVTNVWANRLIGDEQQPPDCQWGKGDQGFGGPLKKFPDWFVQGRPRPSTNRFTFTTWNYFSNESPLVPSGLIGPVRVMVEK